MRQIFDYQDLHVSQTFDSQLRELCIDNLPNLTHIWQGAMPTLLCPNLKSLFPASSAISLLKLESVEVSDCGLEEVIEWDGGLGRLVFPQLISLQLHCLPELSGFYPIPVELSRLRKLGLHHCDKIKIEPFLAGKVWTPFIFS